MQSINQDDGSSVGVSSDDLVMSKGERLKDLISLTDQAATINLDCPDATPTQPATWLAWTN